MLYNLAVDKELIHDPNDDLITEFKGFLNAILLLKKDQEIVCIDFEHLNFFEYEYRKIEARHSMIATSKMMARLYIQSSVYTSLIIDLCFKFQFRITFIQKADVLCLLLLR